MSGSLVCSVCATLAIGSFASRLENRWPEQKSRLHSRAALLLTARFNWFAKIHTAFDPFQLGCSPHEKSRPLSRGRQFVHLPHSNAVNGEDKSLSMPCPRLSRIP